MPSPTTRGAARCDPRDGHGLDGDDQGRRSDDPRASQQDAASVDLQLPEASDRAVKAIADAVRQDRESRSPEARARNIAITLLALIALILAATLAWWLVGRLIRALRARSASDKAVDVAPGVGVPVRPLTEVTISFLRLARLVLLGLMAYFFLSFVLALFPAKRDLAASLTAPFFGSLTAFGNGLLGWLPHLALIVLIAFVAFEVMTFMRIMRDEMLAGRFAIRGFEQDWTEPTYRILSFFVAAVAVMAILPQVPGFDTPSFKAVGLVLSALVTFGSASTVANIFGGVVLIYVRRHFASATSSRSVMQKAKSSARRCSSHRSRHEERRREHAELGGHRRDGLQLQHDDGPRATSP